MTDPHDAAPARISRRDFVRTAAFAGAGLFVSAPAWAQLTEKPANGDEIAVGIIGAGVQGLVLLKKSLLIPNVRFTAVCDVWPYSQRYASNVLKAYDQQVNVYDDYREMLDKEQHLDAVIIASPDWMHVEHAVACLQAGKHVYCEKEMSNTLAKAKELVLAARESGKLLQIGHQRRSNPRYQHALKLIEKDKVLGRITHVYGQWNRPRLLERGWGKKDELGADTLKRFGYDSMQQFRNWRWFRQFSGGPIADLGSHQIDIFNWFLKTPPSAVLADGGLDYYTEDGQWYDNVMAIYEYKAADGPVRGFYQVLNTTSHGGYYETFMGDEGSLVVSEDPRKGMLFREKLAKRRQWEDEASKVEAMDREGIQLMIGASYSDEQKKTAEGQKVLADLEKDIHQLHLENFFDAIRNGTALNCPPEVAYETAATVLKVNDAIEKRQRLTFDPSEFKA